MKVKQKTFFAGAFAALSAVALLPALGVGAHMLGCHHTGPHVLHFIIMVLGPICFLGSAIFVPFWASDLNPGFGLAWFISAFSVVGLTIAACA